MGTYARGSRSDRIADRARSSEIPQSDARAAGVAGVVETQEVESKAEISWQDRLLEALLGMEPAAFERLCQRLLRQAGFSRTQVTGRSGDGGIDGLGVYRVSLVSFQVFYQAKRWRAPVRQADAQGTATRWPSDQAELSAAVALRWLSLAAALALARGETTCWARSSSWL